MRRGVTERRRERGVERRFDPRIPRWRPRFLLVVTVAVVAVGVGACGGGGGGHTQPAGAASGQGSAAKVKLTWWTSNNPTFVAANKDLIKRFEAANPNVTIALTAFPDDVLRQKLQAAYASHTVADMQQMFGSWVPQYARNGLLDPVPSSLTTDVRKRYWGPTLGGYTSAGKLYGLPNEFNLENGGMLANPREFKQAGIPAYPKTWDQLVADARKLTKFNADGKMVRAGFAFTGFDSITFMLLAMILQQNQSYWAGDGVHVDFHTPAAKGAWQALTDLVTKDKVDSRTAYSGDPFDAFFRGQAAMAQHGPWVIPLGKDQFPNFKFDYVPVPPYRGSTYTFAAESGWGEVVNAAAAPDKKAAAWRFIAFSHQEDNLRRWDITTFSVPPLRSLVNDPQILKAVPEMKTSFAVLPYGRYVGPVQDRDRFWQAFQDAFTSVELGRKSAPDALAGAEQQINTMIDQHAGP